MIVVTGAAGFTGSIIVAELEEHGVTDEVVVAAGRDAATDRIDTPETLPPNYQYRAQSDLGHLDVGRLAIAVHAVEARMGNYASPHLASEGPHR